MENLQTLITEKAKDVTVGLSSLFEGLDLSDELKENLQVTFDTAVQTSAVQIAESVLEEATLQLEEKHTQEVLDLAEKLEEKHQEKLDALTEATETYVNDFISEWKEENKLAIDNSLKAKLFDSIFEQLSNIFVEHNLNVPTEEIDVYEELQEDNDELQEKVDSLLKENRALKAELTEKKVKETILEMTAHLTDSQIEKVITLSEQIQVDHNLEKKLKTIIQMVEATSKKEDEDKDKKDKESEDNKDDKKSPEKINENLNYNEPGSGKPAPSVNPTIAEYLKFSR